MRSSSVDCASVIANSARSSGERHHFALALAAASAAFGSILSLSRLGRRGLAVEDGQQAGERVVRRDLPGRGPSGREREGGGEGAAEDRGRQRNSEHSQGVTFE